MREVNFCIPSQNRASVGITTALYDRRALDCTSTLPLINSLNYLAHLTLSSARIREILTVDGGVERLVCILKHGRIKGDMMDTWKWNLAFQCIVNVGVRGSDGRAVDSQGSEFIRTRIVEADVVPVVATILNNYLQIMDRLRHQHEDEEARKNANKLPSGRRHFGGDNGDPRTERRREAPPPIEIPPHQPSRSIAGDQTTIDRSTVNEAPSNPPLHSITSPGEHTLNPHVHHHHHRRHVSHPLNPQSLPRLEAPGHSRQPSQLDYDNLLPPMTSTSQPDTPITPMPPSETRHGGGLHPAQARGPPRRHSLRQELSSTEESEEDEQAESREEPRIEIRGEETMDDMTNPTMMENPDVNQGLPAPNVTGEVNDTAFNVTRSGESIIDSTNATPTPRPTTGLNDPTPEPPGSLLAGGFGQNRTITPDVFTNLVPRDEDVISSLQLLAYVSKYCELRSYFQQTHFVPRLQINQELQKLDGDTLMTNSDVCEEDDDNEMEYCQPNDVNIFPLVEKFTVRHNSSEMKYWAGVVMRNLCRKDKNRGDIRQCAYYKCGKWEDYAKQFAKCRRCRQTKYCSKECQKNAWTLHRWWCTQAQQDRTPNE